MRDGGAHNVVGEGAVAGAVVQAQHIGSVTIHQPGSGPVARAAEDPWAAAVRTSSVWRHVAACRDVERHREAAAATAGALARLRDEAERRLAADPWQDPGSAERFAERLEWLLGEPGDGPGLDLYPAEAALFVLVPYLSRVHDVRVAAALVDVEPWRPTASVDAPERASFEAYADGHRLLVQRAALRPEAEAPIGWWLFHRWLVRHERHAHEDTVRELLDAVGGPHAEVRRVLTPRRVSRLLHALRRGPDVCNPEFLDALSADELVGVQRVRDRRLALLCSLAYALTADMTTLPDIVAEHLGIPHAVDPAALRATLEGSSWGGPADLPVLRAECAHEAVVEGLRAAAARMDEVLHAVTRTVRERVTQPMPRLPVRLSADGVAPAEGAFTGWASFRLDERRVRELLMGVQLYKDPDRAVRELYQNALDACRFRRARTEYLDRTHPAATYAYDGSIVFEQGVDDEGRAYVECRDNGIGMGEAELRGVFSRAGARFAEQPEFHEEQAEWARLDPPVPFHPNSRFGIGVLSYFMLADEIRVTTCRLGRDGRPGPLLEASVFGPGHLFRIVERAREGRDAGTTVRLYLRDARDGWSCPEVLARLLGIAEFTTVARHGEEVARWEPGVLRGREKGKGEQFGLDAHGALAARRGAPAGAQVIWCEHGGGLLVDGLVVQPAVRGGVLSSKASGLVGAVVNLSGPFSPERLSADRSQVLNDLRGTVRDLLAGALDALMAHPLLDFPWLCAVADGSPPLADMVTERCVAGKHGLTRDTGKEYAYRSGRPARSFRSENTGCLPADISLVHPQLLHTFERENPLLREFSVPVPDHVLLWRLLAHRPHPMLRQLAEFSPELDAVGPVLPALPSDQNLLALRLGADWYGPADRVTKLFDAAEALGRTPREVAERAATLGLHEFEPALFPDTPVHRGGPTAGTVADIVRRQRRYHRGPSVPLLVTMADPVALKTVDEAAAVLADSGVDVPEALVDTARAVVRDEELRAYLRASADVPWFAPGAGVPPGQLVQTALELDLEVPDLCGRLTACGLTADATGLPTVPTPDVLSLLKEESEAPFSWWLAPTVPVPAMHVLRASELLGLTIAEAMHWYEVLGFIPPSPFPTEVEPDDLAILAQYSDDMGLEYAPLRAGEPVPYLHVLIAVSECERPLHAVAARLRAYGIRVPALDCAEPADLDEELFVEDGALNWTGVHTDEPMPFAHILAAARRLLIQPREIVGRLAAYGIASSCPDVPEGLTYERALWLLETGEEDILLSAEEGVDFSHLITLARRMGEPIAVVRHWLVQLGIPVADPAEAIRAALPRIPRPGGA
ncbi:wHTH domain-containing protein [Streptomyces coeruleoprunus]|uniref:wHTH domain-containing protein n=1 Tax=Streptomyces coeruleoprunus TaxID=285563 RepID=UPI0035ED4AA8